MLRPVERGQVFHRSLQGMPPLFHVRLKHQGRTLAVLSGDTEREAEERARRLSDVLFPSGEGFTIEPA